MVAAETLSQTRWLSFCCQTSYSVHLTCAFFNSPSSRGGLENIRLVLVISFVQLSPAGMSPASMVCRFLSCDMWVWRKLVQCWLVCSLCFSVYVAGKAAKAGYPPAVSSIPGPYYIPSVPVAGVPSPAVLMDKSHPPPLAPSDTGGGNQNGNSQHSVHLLGAGLRKGRMNIICRVLWTG